MVSRDCPPISFYEALDSESPEIRLRWKIPFKKVKSSSNWISV